MAASASASATLIPLLERTVPLQVVPGVPIFFLVSVYVQNHVEGGKGVVA